MQRIKGISNYRKSLREKIIDISMRAFAEKGVRAVKMDNVAQSMSISKRTIYEIFGTKENLLFEGVRYFNQQRMEKTEKAVSQMDNVMDVLLYVYYQKVDEFKEVNPVFYSDLRRYPEIVDYLKLESEKSKQALKEFIRRGISEGYFRSDVNIELLSMMIDSMTDLIMKNELYKSYTMDEIFRHIVFVSIRGICTLKGVERLDEITTTVRK